MIRGRSAAHLPLRIELPTHPSLLPRALAPFLARPGPQFNVADTHRSRAPLAVARAVLAAFSAAGKPAPQVCAHYSLAVRGGDPDAFAGFLAELGALDVPSGPDGEPGPRPTVLLVSGSGGGHVAGHDSLAVLRALRPHLDPARTPGIFVAFDPYPPDPRLRNAERDRLLAKLGTGLVIGAALQFGTDLRLLDGALPWLRGLPLGEVHGSWFYPTLALLERLRERPIPGVRPGAFLEGGLRGARRCARGLARAYGEEGVVPIVQAPGGWLGEGELRRAEALLRGQRGVGRGDEED
ncbi:hypothetical protein DFJ74DRAFT_745147 [Hyaloraphidium curvatum]|nr:hypothetical protein DFJ74DRAFT_745147 [Hyaloraphidium curvatum]